MFNTPTAIVADDETNLNVYLCQLLGTLWPELSIVGTAANGKEATDLIHRLEPDFAFLDIKMPVATGLEVAIGITGKTQVVFVTAYDEFAIEAFESAAVDYLLKPVESDRLAKTVARLKSESVDYPDREKLVELVAQFVAKTGDSNQQYLSWIRAGLQGETKIISVDDIDYFKADHKYTSIFAGGAEHLIRKSIKDLAQELDPQKFWQIHRSSIVNVQSIEVARKDFRGRYTVFVKGIKSGLKVSDPYSYLFRQM
jgi:DNA-binding LytR/AlgR family response regulator